MEILITRIFDASLIFIWMAIWFLGGYLIVINAFKVHRHESTILGFGVGLILQVWVANWLGQVLEPVLAFWLSAIIILIIGIFLTLILKNHKVIWKSISFPLSYWIPFVVILVIFFLIGRGLAIFDDYQNLPVTSYIASGAIPPNFVLNPEKSFDYHYLMLLNAAQWMRIADLFPWTALDLNRALFLSLSVILAAIFGYRITRNRLAGWLTAVFFAFAGGLRWVLLFIPAPILEKISDHITMMGSGQVTAETLSGALIKNWAIEGAGPIPFPFAFGNGFHNISVFKHDGTGMMGAVIAILIILLFERWKNLSGELTITILLSAMAMIDEIWFVFFIAAAGIFFILQQIIQKRLPNREKWLELLLLIVIPVFFSIIQGGVLTGVARGLLAGVMGIGNAGADLYYSIDFPVRWPPAIISAHLGVLSLTHWAQLVVAFFEVGPIFLIFPLLIIWSLKAFRAQKTIFSILAIGVGLSILAIFVEYQGSAGISASKRLLLFGTDLLDLFAVPLLWHWLSRKRMQVKMLVSGITFMTMVGGMIYFLISSIAIQRPVLSYFINLMDASVQNIYWDQLDENAMVFDFNPSRATTIFARPIKSSITWYEDLPEYKRMQKNPDPFLLNEAGFSHMYISREDYRHLSARSKYLLKNACISRVYENEDWQGDFRWLLDISACKK
ncbi:MAG: hypothetical protein IH585_07630 [Anaerolineaceae bacterium]|nr:hypothetical protein [Anaerolineaceae bacterium]